MQSARRPFRFFVKRILSAKIQKRLVLLVNQILSFVPFKIKYGIGQWLRRNVIPYTLLEDCQSVVQVGAPHDTLLSGRSRGMYFALMAPPKVKVTIIEPNSQSVRLFKEQVQRQQLMNVELIHMGVWFEKDTLKLWVKDGHPATNVTEQSRFFNRESLLKDGYQEVAIEVDSLEHILVTPPDLVSVTINGNELEALKGMTTYLASSVKYICIAALTNEITAFLDTYGFSVAGFDDRGVTFSRRTSPIQVDNNANKST